MYMYITPKYELTDDAKMLIVNERVLGSQAKSKILDSKLDSTQLMNLIKYLGVGICLYISIFQKMLCN